MVVVISDVSVDLTLNRFDNLLNTIVYRPAAGAGRVAVTFSGTATAFL